MGKRKRKRKDSQALTTGQAAKMLGVHPETIRNLIDSGVLPGWRLAGSSHRRVSRVLISMMKTRWERDGIRDFVSWSGIKFKREGED